MKLSTRCIEDITPGMVERYERTVTDADIVGFADVSGDDNPVHLDDEYAAGTRFGERIAHGMLSAAFISTVIGTKLPGPGAIYISQTLLFRAPVKIGDTVTAECVVREVLTERRRLTLDCRCLVGDTVVLDGEAVVMAPSRAAA